MHVHPISDLFLTEIDSVEREPSAGTAEVYTQPPNPAPHHFILFSELLPFIRAKQDRPQAPARRAVPGKRRGKAAVREITEITMPICFLLTVST